MTELIDQLRSAVQTGTAPADEALSALAKTARRRLLQMHFEAKVGHIGGNLSCLDALLALHHRVMRGSDELVLSKGHAAGALYVTLWTRGQLSDEDLKTFHRDGTRLAGHPISGWNPAIPFATGSLGHGIGLAAGLALGKRLQKQPGRVFCLMSDGEWQEGSCWEALIFAGHQRLDNLTIVVDANGLQGFGTTAEVASFDNLLERCQGFGFELFEAAGHDHAALAAALGGFTVRPRLVVLRTVKGKGVSFMENQVAWHYLPMSEAQYAAALGEVDAV